MFYATVTANDEENFWISHHLCIIFIVRVCFQGCRDYRESWRSSSARQEICWWLMVFDHPEEFPGEKFNFFAERFHCCLELLFTERTSVPDGPTALHHQHGSVTANCTLRMVLFTLCFLFSSTPGLIIATRQKCPTVFIFGHESVSAFIEFLFNAIFQFEKVLLQLFPSEHLCTITMAI